MTTSETHGEGTWLYTANGDLDPLWLLLIAHLAMGFVLTLVGIFGGDRAFLVAVGNNILSILILAVIKVPIDRARLLAPALAKGMEALPTLVQPPHPGMDKNER
jgi:hypothetical protein